MDPCFFVLNKRLKAFKHLCEANTIAFILLKSKFLLFTEVFLI